MASVSVLMAAFNAEHFIDEAIESVLLQTYQDWELIIIDDCSTDGVRDHISAKYSEEPRIKYRRLDRNSGPAAARNVGIECAQGTWLTILDSDDRYLPGRLAALLSAGEGDDLDLICDNQLYYDSNQAKVVQPGFVLKSGRVALTTELLLRNDGPPLRFSFGALKPFCRRDFLMRHHIRYPEDLRVGEDFVFLFEMLIRKARAILIAEPYYLYTIPIVRAQLASSKTRTNYGIGNLESLIAANAKLLGDIAADAPNAAELKSLLNVRDRRLRCSLALRDMGGGGVLVSARRLLEEAAWGRFAFDKVRNVFQRSHVVRGAARERRITGVHCDGHL